METRARQVLDLLEKEAATGGGGQSAGKFEVDKMTLEQARKFAEDRGFDLSTVPDFDKNFKAAQKAAKKGWTKRKDMPVIETEDVRKLQTRLEKGTLDINKPFADDTDPKHPFPQGLSGLEAQKFMKRGLRDGSLKDDQIDVRITRVRVGDLSPIQKQIYFDKGFGSTIQFGLESSLDFIQNKSFFIISKDMRIIDGHHRFLSAMLIDPNMQVNALQIDLPLKKLLPLSLSYSDAIGRKRNQ